MDEVEKLTLEYPSVQKVRKSRQNSWKPKIFER